MWRSEWQSPQRSIRTRTSVPCGFGVSTMVSHSGASNFTNDCRCISAMGVSPQVTLFVLPYIGQFAGHGNKATDRNGLGAPGRIDMSCGRKASRFDGEGLKTLPQHFPALAESRGRNLLQRPAIASL